MHHCGFEFPYPKTQSKTALNETCISYIYDSEKNVTQNVWAYPDKVFVCFLTLLSYPMTNHGTKPVTIRVRYLKVVKNQPSHIYGKGLPLAGNVGTKVQRRRTIALIVVFKPQMRDQVFAPKMTKGVFQLHQLNKNIVLRIKTGRGHW